METIKASVVEHDDKHFIEIEAEDETIKIPLSDDKANDVKHAFNQLIGLIKKGAVEIELEDVGEDLFSQVADEYIGQLNREIMEVRGEMIDLNLIDGDVDDDEGFF